MEAEQEKNNLKQTKQQKAEKLAAQIMNLARDTIVVHMRFLDSALAALRPQPSAGLNGMAADGARIFYDPIFLLRRCRKDTNYAVRMYLHILLHSIFYHSFQYGRVEEELWDLTADIAVENTILEMELPAAALKTDEEARERLAKMKNEAGGLTAEKLYKYYKANPFYEEEKEELRRLFKKDEHIYWQAQEELFMTNEQWRKITERIKADLKTFSKGKSNSDSLKKNLAEATKEKYDYAEILRRFTVTGEDIRINDDEFDYIYYTYGLSQYGNIPLIEPLEYKDVKKIKEFVIAIDTSASCRGAVVQAFLNKTYTILKGTENFFNKINVHIIQCDSEVQSDTKITCDDEFEYFIRNGELKGFGATDFRPVFEYVDKLLEDGEFENLKGIIYFTDGYGVYPERMPDYETMFVFLEEDDAQPEVPPWAVKVILEEE